MRIFISWSGDASRHVARELAHFMESTFAGHVETFMSDIDISPGERFQDAINERLENSTLGILVLTRANTSEPWILFEAGALAGKAKTGNVVPILVDLERSELRPPLNQFNNVLSSSQEDILKLCQRVRLESGNKPSEQIMGMIFTQAWPGLKEAFESAKDSSKPVIDNVRSDNELLNEILLGVNSLVRSDAGLFRHDPPARVESLRDNSGLELKPGHRIVHADFGQGTVTEILGVGSKRIATVDFDNAGTKRLLVKLAPIEFIQPR